MNVNFACFDVTRSLFKTPECATKQSVGYDLFVNEYVHIPVRAKLTVSLNLCWAPDGPIMAKFFEKSGLASQGLQILAGVIDADYRGEWKVICHNCGEHPIEIQAGKAIAQVVFMEVLRPDDLTVLEAVRGEGGFGSTNA